MKTDKIPIVGFQRNDGVIFMKKKNGYISTTLHPKIIDGRVVCPELRKLVIVSTENKLLKNGFIPIYETK